MNRYIEVLARAMNQQGQRWSYSSELTNALEWCIEIDIYNGHDGTEFHEILEEFNMTNSAIITVGRLQAIQRAIGIMTAPGSDDIRSVLVNLKNGLEHHRLESESWALDALRLLVSLSKESKFFLDKDTNKSS